jgi:Dynamin family
MTASSWSGTALPADGAGKAAGRQALGRLLDPDSSDNRKFLQDLGKHAGRLLAERVRRDMTDGVAELEAGSLRIVFGGHFSSGKSTMINMLIGRPLLPASSYPETGVPCVIRSGAENSIKVVAGSGTRTVPFGTESIAAAVRIVGKGGIYREVVRENTRLDVTLTAADPIGPDTVWVDSPGINDTPVMTERAEVAARDADVLIWVVNSRQPVSEVEQAALRDHIATHGPASVVFLVNAFLDEDTRECWDEFMTELAPDHITRIEQLVDTGLLSKQIVFASARAAAADPAAFGGPQARGLLAELTVSARWRTTATRAYRVKAGLTRLAAELDGLAEAEDGRLAAMRSDLEAAAERTTRRHADFMTDVGQQARLVLARHRDAADAAVTATVGMVNRTTRPHNFYGQALTALLTSVAEKITDDMAAAVAVAARAHGQASLSATAQRELTTLLMPMTIQIAGLDKSMGVGAGAAAGAVAGLAAGTVVPILGHAIGLGIGAIIGGSRGKSVQDERLARLRTQIRQAGGSAVTAMCGSGNAIVSLVRRACPPPGAPPEPDASRLTCLRQARTTVTRLAADLEAAHQNAVQPGTGDRAAPQGAER